MEKQELTETFNYNGLNIIDGVAPFEDYFYQGETLVTLWLRSTTGQKVFKKFLNDKIKRDHTDIGLDSEFLLFLEEKAKNTTFFSIATQKNLEQANVFLINYFLTPNFNNFIKKHSENSPLSMDEKIENFAGVQIQEKNKYIPLDTLPTNKASTSLIKKMIFDKEPLLIKRLTIEQLQREVDIYFQNILSKSEGGHLKGKNNIFVKQFIEKTLSNFNAQERSELINNFLEEGHY